MPKLPETLMPFRRDTRGVTAIEYAIIAGVLCVTLGVAFTGFSTRLASVFASLTL